MDEIGNVDYSTKIPNNVALSEDRQVLRALEVWPRCEGKAAALRVMRLVDDTGRLIRAPEVRFSCDEIGLEIFGYNIENRLLVSALEERSAGFSNLTRFDEPVLFSTNDGLTICGANLHRTYYGQGTGLWALDCAAFPLLR